MTDLELAQRPGTEKPIAEMTRREYREFLARQAASAVDVQTPAAPPEDHDGWRMDEPEWVSAPVRPYLQNAHARHRGDEGSAVADPWQQPTADAWTLEEQWPSRRSLRSSSHAAPAEPVTAPLPAGGFDIPAAPALWYQDPETTPAAQDPSDLDITSLVPLTRRQLRERDAADSARQAMEARRARRARAGSITQQLPRVSLVGALGLATVVTPLVHSADNGSTNVGKADDLMASSNQLTPQLGKPVNAADLMASASLRAPQRAASPVEMAVGQQLTAQELISSRQAAEQASRDYNRELLPGCGAKSVSPNAPNGRLDVGDLCQLWQPSDYLRADAAIALAKLNQAYMAEFGEPIEITDSYRNLASQISVKARKPGLAARPGTSNHGWGLAVDLGGGVSGGGARYQWMRVNAPKFGWDNPAWARPGGHGPHEPWHWEYVAGETEEQRQGYSDNGSGN